MTDHFDSIGRITMKNRGFTLIELLIVIAIIGILAMIAIPAYVGQQKRAARTEAYANLENLRLLEEQYFAENGRYTASLGAAGNTVGIRDANLVAIQTTLNESLPGFRPGEGGNFSYRTIQNNQLNTPVANPPVWAASPAGTLCFVAVATGIVSTRVAGDVHAIDCNNVRNF
jgi:prepilin-type N-terminal cleavage/methylation domain-containing protein